MKKLTLLATLALAFPAFAAPTTEGMPEGRMLKPGKMTCEEFAGLDETVRPRVVYFLEGVTKTGKVEESVISVDEVTNPVLWVAEECKKTPKATVWQKVENWVKTKSKKL